MSITITYIYNIGNTFWKTWLAFLVGLLDWQALQIAKESVPRSWSPGPAPTRDWLTTAACVRSLTSAGHICWQTWRIFQAWWLVESSPHPLNMQMWSPPQPTSPYEGPEAPWSSLGKDNEVLTRRAIRLCMTWRTGVLRRREASANFITCCWAEDVFTIHDCQEDLVKPSVNRTIVFGVYSALCVCCLFPPGFPATTAPNSIPVSSRVQACSAIYMYSMYSLFASMSTPLTWMLNFISFLSKINTWHIYILYIIYIYAVHIHAYTRTGSHHTFVSDVPRHWLLNCMSSFTLKHHNTPQVFHHVGLPWQHMTTYLKPRIS